ncbi:Zinc finger CCCH domain-containing protein [Quillaja saponaria]|uniref:Zinc finger CCCH domain-containing protein n=1 Tax=Quillaja saponaria TaxID=32244 RepID=A0AAD7QD60_QUISA|nr:Zinc finger CCCH domain-containing protein [Quillaja saponaria]
MEKSQLENPKPSESLIGFAPHRRSHLKSETYRSLVQILSHCYDDSEQPRASPIHVHTEELKVPGDGISTVRQTNGEKESHHAKLVGPDCMNPEESVSEKDKIVHGRFGGVDMQGRDYKDTLMVINDIDISAAQQTNGEKESHYAKLVGPVCMNLEESVSEKDKIVHGRFGGLDMQGSDYKDTLMVINGTDLILGEKEDDDSSRRHNMAIHESTEGMSSQDKGFGQEQKLIDEFDHILKGTEKLVFDYGFTTSNSGVDKNQGGLSEVELMANKKEHVDFQQSLSATRGQFQADKEQCIQQVSEGFLSSSNNYVPSEVSNHVENREEQIFLPKISELNIEHEKQQKEMVLLPSISTSYAMGSLPMTEDKELKETVFSFQKMPEAIDLSSDEDMISAVLNMSEYGGKGSSLLDSLLEAKHDVQHEDKQLEQMVGTSNAMNSSNHSIEDGVTEEGEISGDLRMDDESFDLFFNDALPLEENKVDEVKKRKNVIERTVFPLGVRNREKDSESTSFVANTLHNANNGGKVEPRGSDTNGLSCRFESAIPGKHIKSKEAGGISNILRPGTSKSEDIGNKEAVEFPAAFPCKQVHFSEEKAAGTSGIMSIVKEADVSRKKKRGPPSEEKKARKKQKERKKRAEKNRQLGVKRLKLQPVLKPKAVTYCRHYLKGRCHEGEKCKFSHDTVPLTKSKPCCHFARHSCMKGDDCPFDHQLSKYPCSNFVSRGSCSRGDNCMFSHKKSPKEDLNAVSNVCTPELKPSASPGSTNFNKHVNVSGSYTSQHNRFSGSVGSQPSENTQHDVADIIVKQPKFVPKGVSFFNVDRINSRKLNQGISTPRRSDGLHIGNQTDQSESGTAQSSREITLRTPPVAPKGINFLSFGKGTLGASSSKSPVSVNRDNGIKPSPLDNFGLPEQASLTPSRDDPVEVGSKRSQSVSQTMQYTNETLKKIQPVGSVEGMNLIVPVKAVIDESASHKYKSLPSGGGDIVHRPVQEVANAFDVSQTSTVISGRTPVSSFGSGQSSERLGSGYYGNTSKSAQKALLSTFAFASKYETDIKMKHSN